MEIAKPGQQTILTQSGIPTGSDVGFQVVKAVSGTVSIGRTTAGVQERPLSSGNFVIVFNAPPEGDTYLVIVDWAAGVIDPFTSRVIELRVTDQPQPGSAGLGAVADYARMYLGGEIWSGLMDSTNYGPDALALNIDTVKRRVMTAPPATADEALLNPLALNYLGLLVALQLIPAARDYWGNRYISISSGDDPVENVTYANRANLVSDLRDDIMRQLAAAQKAAIPVIDHPVLIADGDGPAIDEIDDCKVTADPHVAPHFGFGGRGPWTPDAYGVDTPRTSGVRL